jgi:hypothetical protein
MKNHQIIANFIVITATIYACHCGPRNPSDVKPLPDFKKCQNTEHPILPEKWEATAVLQDFSEDQLMFGKFIFDEQAGAFRFSTTNSHGLDHDFLVTKKGELYLLSGGKMPTSCELKTRNSLYTVPSRDWLSKEAICTGEAPLLGKKKTWWKTPKAPGANWIWYDSQTRLPFRTMYYTAPLEPSPIYEFYTFNYFPKFEEVSETNLTEILKLCQRQQVSNPNREWKDMNVDTFISQSFKRKKQPVVPRKAQEWIPGLTQCKSTEDLPPQWPERVQATVIFTAVNFEYNPFPSRVFYDWEKKAQNSSLFYHPSSKDNFAQVALLTGNTGYIRYEKENGSISFCAQALPGPQVRDWKKVDECECRAEIAANSPLNPSDTPTKILWCPTDLNLNQVFWTWYSKTGKPVVFMQSNSSPVTGTGLNLADYYDWVPGSIAPPKTFHIPEECKNKPKQKVPNGCHNCHLPLNKEFQR